MTKEAKELRAQSAEELVAIEQQKRLEIFKLKNALANKDKEVKFDNLRKNRKEIARILTIRREKELGLKR